MSPFASAYPDLQRLGYHVLPIIPPGVAHGGAGKAPGEFVMGSWRGMPKWQALRDAAPTKFQTDLWARYEGANVGIVLGSPIGPLRLLAVDVDVTDHDELSEILRALPYSPMCKRGAKGETRFYAAPAEIKTACYDRAPVGDEKARRLVDLLTGFDTRQTVAPPSIHPDGMTYVWMEGPVSVYALPVFDADALAVLEETLETLGWVRGGATRQRRDHDPSVVLDSDDFFTETKVRALADMDAWVHDLDLYDLRPARGGYEAVATWRASSTGKPIAERKRNLSIQTAGIKDFGTNWTGSAIDLVMQAQGLDQPAATSWLRMRLGLTGDVMILEPRASKGIPITEPEPHVIHEPQPRTDSTELPDHMTRVPGLVGQITDWICDSSRRPQRGLALGAALTLVGTAAGRKVAGPTRSGTHLYVLGVARTAAGKDHALDAIASVLEASAMSSHLGPSQFMSMSALINCLTRTPLLLAPMDEFGSFMARVNGKRASPHEKGITGVLRTAWGKSFKSMNPPEWAGRSGVTIYSPAFSLYGVSTHEEFYAAIDGADVFNGFLNRFLTISTQERPAERDPAADSHEVPDAISKGMIAIYNLGGILMGATSHAGRSDGPAVTVPWDHASAQAVYVRFGKYLEAREGEAAMLGRTHEMSVRLATIRAIGRSTVAPRVTVDDMEWGRDLALWSAERMIADAQDHMSENDYQRDVHHVLRTIKARGAIKKRDLLRALGNRTKERDIDAILQALVNTGQLEEEVSRPPSGGREIKSYRAAAD